MAPGPVVIRIRRSRNVLQWMLHGVVRRSGFGVRLHGLQFDRTALGIVHRSGRSVVGPVGTRSDEGILTPPLIVKPVRGEYLIGRLIAVGQRAEVAVHHRIAVENDRSAIGIGVVVRSPHMPAPDQRPVRIVCADECVALVDPVVLVLVGPHVEGDLSVVQRQVLDQIRLRLPDDIDRSRSERALSVTLVHGVERVVALPTIDQIAVRRTVAHVHRLRNADEERRRDALPPERGSREGQRSRPFRLLLFLRSFVRPGIVFEDGGCGDPDTHRALVQHDGIVPAHGFGRDGVALDIGRGESDRRRPARLQEHRGAVERQFARILVLAARHRGCRRQQHERDKGCKSFHTVQFQKSLQRYQKAQQFLLRVPNISGLGTIIAALLSTNFKAI